MLEPPLWMQDAACKDLPQSWFFTGDLKACESELRGLQVCKTCPVRIECLAFSKTIKAAAGVWGGRTTEQRIRRK